MTADVRVPWGYENPAHLIDNSIYLGKRDGVRFYATETDDPEHPWALWYDEDLPNLVNGAWIPFRSLSELLREWREQVA